eukprot:Gb_24138 [translate_table: standard]
MVRALRHKEDIDENLSGMVIDCTNKEGTDRESPDTTKKVMATNMFICHIRLILSSVILEMQKYSCALELRHSSIQGAFVCSHRSQEGIGDTETREVISQVESRVFKGHPHAYPEFQMSAKHKWRTMALIVEHFLRGIGLETSLACSTVAYATKVIVECLKRIILLPTLAWVSRWCTETHTYCPLEAMRQKIERLETNNTTKQEAKALASPLGGKVTSLDKSDNFCPEDRMILANTTSMDVPHNVNQTPVSKEALATCSSLNLIAGTIASYYWTSGETSEMSVCLVVFTANPLLRRMGCPRVIAFPCHSFKQFRNVQCVTLDHIIWYMGTWQALDQRVSSSPGSHFFLEAFVVLVGLGSNFTIGEVSNPRNKTGVSWSWLSLNGSLGAALQLSILWRLQRQSSSCKADHTCIQPTVSIQETVIKESWVEEIIKGKKSIILSLFNDLEF